MTGRSLHDALLLVLGHASVRTRLLKGDPTLIPCLGEEEHAVLSRLPAERVDRLARFLARHYYRERLVRLFRYVRLLASRTRRDPVAILSTPQALTILDEAVLGSPDTSERLIRLATAFLTDRDDEIQQAHPYWRDLVDYQAAMFLVEAAGPPTDGTAHPGPHRSPAMRVLELQWDIPTVITHLRTGQWTVSDLLKAPTRLLVARSHQGLVTTVRCPEPIRRLLEALDGQTCPADLAVTVGLTPEQTQNLLQQLCDIGAVLWPGPTEQSGATA
ncbi:MAG: hypothetical protein ACREI3_03565 [Nitrospirales bacterium]